MNIKIAASSLDASHVGKRITFTEGPDTRRTMYADTLVSVKHTLTSRTQKTVETRVWLSSTQWNGGSLMGPHDVGLALPGDAEVIVEADRG